MIRDDQKAAFNLGDRRVFFVFQAKEQLRDDKAKREAKIIKPWRYARQIMFFVTHRYLTATK